MNRRLSFQQKAILFAATELGRVDAAMVAHLFSERPKRGRHAAARALRTLAEQGLFTELGTATTDSKQQTNQFEMTDAGRAAAYPFTQIDHPLSNRLYDAVKVVFSAAIDRQRGCNIYSGNF